LKPLSRLSAWFYDYPDFNVTAQEFAVLLAVKDGPMQEADVAIKLGLRRDDLKTLLHTLRRKRLLGRYRPRRVEVVSAMGLVDPVAQTIEFSDAEQVYLSMPGRKLLKSRNRREA
jgi:hypothetical protein